MQFTEPSTMLTDYALAVWTGFLGARLWRKAAGQRARRLWAASFGATGVAALLGGTVHGFQLMLAATPLAVLWKATVYSIGLGSLLLFLGAVFATLRGPERRVLVAVGIIKFAVYFVWMGLHDEFRYVVFFYVPDMLGVIALLAAVRPGANSSARAWGIGGVLASLTAAAVQVSGFSLHTHFNHNDLYHLMQAGAFLCLYRGGAWLCDPAGT
ncbi:MAG: hypothetical protein L0Z53_11020 [Acidobacteriales bacterium]|nr:hypothetical protein [Terriglobales bacterium]